jgi:hypothetical protein
MFTSVLPIGVSFVDPMYATGIQDKSLTIDMCSDSMFCLLIQSFIFLVQYGGMTTKGRLVLRMSTDENPRWQVEIEAGKETTEKELYESSFGEIIENQTLEEPKTVRKSNKRKESIADESIAKLAEEPALEPENSDTSKPKAGSQRSSDNNANSDSSTTPSDNSKKAARASAREERVRRREAKVEVKASTTSSFASKKQKKFHHNSTECIKIPMLTGTLYLYHGMTRRAEFVRKV